MWQENKREVQQTRATCPQHVADEIGLSMWRLHVAVEAEHTTRISRVCQGFQDKSSMQCVEVDGTAAPAT